MTYDVGAEEEPLLVLSPPRDMSLKRLSMLGKKSSLGKTSSLWASVMTKWPVVVQHAPQKTCHLSPVHDHKRRGMFQRPIVPDRGARCKTGWGKTVKQHKAVEPGGRSEGSGGCVLCLRRCDLTFIGT
jgi:hypothetical protein